MVSKREIFAGMAGLAALFAFWRPNAPAQAGDFPLKRPDGDWKKRLTPAQYDVLRDSGTERPFSSALLDEHRAGTFACAGCESALFASNTKFESHTGWPSFWQPLAGAVGEETDRSFGFRRTEVHCSRCGGHLGHVFNDGPKPTGLRYCMNGVALSFRPSEG